MGGCAYRCLQYKRPSPSARVLRRGGGKEGLACAGREHAYVGRELTPTQRHRGGDSSGPKPLPLQRNDEG